MSDYIAHDHQQDGIDRRGFLRCMAWAGTGVVFGVIGDRVVTTALADALQGKAAVPAADFSDAPSGPDGANAAGGAGRNLAWPHWHPHGSIQAR